MASSNRHWPSMFKCKPINSHQHWQHDSYPAVQGREERNPEPKARWNPKQEQIRILEAIFNSGMVNPSRDEIRKITIQLQEYGQVGDANVFYWFQNRKSRSKHKLRHLQNSKQNTVQQQTFQTNYHASVTALSAVPSSSSEKYSSKDSDNSFAMTPSNILMDASYSPAGSVDQSLFQALGEFLQEPLFPFQQRYVNDSFTQEVCFSDMSNLAHPEQMLVQCNSLLPSEVMNSRQAYSKDQHQQVKMIKNIEQQLDSCYSTDQTVTPTITSNVTVPSNFYQVQQGLEQLGSDHMGSASRILVYINDVAIEMAMAHFNVQEAFGDDAMLLHSYGQPVLTDEFGVTLEPLQHGASYHLISSRRH